MPLSIGAAICVNCAVSDQFIYNTGKAAGKAAGVGTFLVATAHLGSPLQLCILGANGTTATFSKTFSAPFMRPISLGCKNDSVTLVASNGPLNLKSGLRGGFTTSVVGRRCSRAASWEGQTGDAINVSI
jgi:hypothetical protein